MNRLFLLLFGAMSLVAHAQVPDYVPTDGLVAWYPFNGNAMNELNTENEFNVNGPVNVSDRFGIPSNAYYFDGIDDEIIASNPGVSGSEISLSFWYQSAQVDYSAYLIAFGGPAWGTYFEVMNNHWSTQTPGPCYGPALSGGGTLVSRGTEWMPDSLVWHHCAVILPEGALSLNDVLFYFDGSMLTSLCSFANYGAPEPNISISENILFGSGLQDQGNWSSHFEGSMDDIGIWNHALTEEEVLALYNGDPPIPGCTDPTACNFDAEANEDDGSCLSTLELSLQNQIQISSEGELVLTAPETLQNWTWDNGTSDSSIPIGSGGTFSIQGVIGVIPEIGSELNEGLIFDIDSLNQIVYIASPEEIGTGSEWGCYGTSTGATGQGMGDGLTNTQLILENCSDDNSAAAVASEYGENWYLPSFEELNAIRTQLHDSGFGDYSMNNPLSINWYWSSTECSENPDWAAGSMIFFDGFYGACNNKNSNPGGVIAAKMVQGGFCLFTDTITIEVDCSESNDLSANGTSCGPGTYWDELESLCLPIETCQDDLDGDGVIGINDLMQLLSSFGTMCEEPETANSRAAIPSITTATITLRCRLGSSVGLRRILRTELYQNGDCNPWPT